MNKKKPIRMDDAERARRALEEFYTDGPVETGFTYRTELLTEPVERVLLEIGSSTGSSVLRLFFEKSQFAELADWLVSTGRDYGCYD